jgi:hypothetical protein
LKIRSSATYRRDGVTRLTVLKAELLICRVAAYLNLKG